MNNMMNTNQNEANTTEETPIVLHEIPAEENPVFNLKMGPVIASFPAL